MGSPAGHPRIANGKIYFKFRNRPDSVVVTSLKEYKTLLVLSLDFLQLQDGDITVENLKRAKLKDKDVKSWYTENLEYQYSHERSHFLGANSIKTLKTYLGVCFYYDDREINSYPFVTFDGYANLKEFKEKVVSAPEEMSENDLRFMKC